ncbi:MAG: prepilin peptidase [Planctomycetes bacterium]|nr:prepilin peptidase [Planctomycetota bacterium]
MDVVSYMVWFVVAILGLFIGSFLNVVIYRLPRECLSVWKQTRSRCPRCSVQLRWFDNIPLLSYVVLLRGRCFNCGKRISMRYPLIELFTGLVFLALLGIDLDADRIAWFDLTDPAWRVFAVHALVASTLIALSVIDIDHRILPDAITKPAIVLAPALAFLVPAAVPSSFWRPFAMGEWSANLNALANGVVSAAAASGFLWSIGWLGSKAFRKPAMGLGDVKLFAGMGGLLGPWFLLVLVVASFVGSLIGLVVMAIRKDRYVPFGPFLAFGMMVVMLRGEAIWKLVMTWLAPR